MPLSKGEIVARAGAGLLALLLPAGCSMPLPTGDAQQPAECSTDGPALTAKKVTVDIALPRGQLVMRGERIALGATDNSMHIEGDASVVFEGSLGLKARAARMTVWPDGPKLDMQGRVRASLAVPSLEATNDGK